MALRGRNGEKEQGEAHGFQFLALDLVTILGRLPHDYELSFLISSHSHLGVVSLLFLFFFFC